MKFKLWAPVIVWAALIFLFSGIPNLNSGLDEDFILRKIAHVFEYLVLTFLLYRVGEDLCVRLKSGSTHRSTPTLHRITWLVIYPSVISVLYAASDEFHQTFVVGRQGCFNDVLIDSVGIFVLYLILLLQKKI
jgi:VanZ family protein